MSFGDGCNPSLHELGYLFFYHETLPLTKPACAMCDLLPQEGIQFPDVADCKGYGDFYEMTALMGRECVMLKTKKL